MISIHIVVSFHCDPNPRGKEIYIFTIFYMYLSSWNRGWWILEWIFAVILESFFSSFVLAFVLLFHLFHFSSLRFHILERYRERKLLVIYILMSFFLFCYNIFFIILPLFEHEVRKRERRKWEKELRRVKKGGECVHLFENLCVLFYSQWDNNTRHYLLTILSTRFLCIKKMIYSTLYTHLD